MFMIMPLPIFRPFVEDKSIDKNKIPGKDKPANHTEALWMIDKINKMTPYERGIRSHSLVDGDWVCNDTGKIMPKIVNKSTVYKEGDPIPRYKYEKYAMHYRPLRFDWIVSRQGYSEDDTIFYIDKVSNPKRTDHEGGYTITGGGTHMTSCKANALGMTKAQATHIVKNTKPSRVQVDEYGQHLGYTDKGFIDTSGFTAIYKDGVVVEYRKNK